MRPTALLTALIILLPLLCKAQQTDTVAPVQHSPKRAALYSAVVPSLGQAYNHKWWKMPIVLGGVAGLGYYGYINYMDFDTMKKACAYKAGNSTYTNAEIDQLVAKYSETQLQTIRNDYRRSFEISCIAMFAWWVLNIVDATVDAYFFEYDISSDLSMSVSPCMMNAEVPTMGMTTGVSLKFNF